MSHTVIRSMLAIMALLSCRHVAADPVLSVIDVGLNGNSNREWLVSVAPDPALFSMTPEGLGGSLAVELAFEVSGSDVLGVTPNSFDFPFTSNAGFNPFTGTVTLGVDIDFSGDTVFAALGSDFLTSGASVSTLTIETMGSAATTLSWGGHTLLPGTSFEFIGSRIAQDATKFDGYQGSLSSTSVTGDFNNDSQWNCADIDLLVAEIASGGSDLSLDMNGDGAISASDVTDAGNGWLAAGGANNPSQTGGNAFLVGDANLDGNVDGADFLVWNGHKFTSVAAWCSGDFTVDGNVDGGDFLAWNGSKFTSSDVTAIPEPAAAWLVVVLSIGAIRTLRPL